MLPRFCAHFVSAAWAQAEREATAALVDLAQAAVGELGAGSSPDSACAGPPPTTTAASGVTAGPVLFAVFCWLGRRQGGGGPG